MNYFSALHLVVYGFLLLTLVLGWYAGRNVKTFRDYATANRSLNLGVLIMTLLATTISQGRIGNISYTYLTGPRTTAHGPFFIGFLLLAALLSKRMFYFSGCLTMAQVMGKLYGEWARRWTAWFTLGVTLMMVTAQLAFIAKYIGPLLGLSKLQTVWSIGGLIILYSALGGMRSVAYTDVLQFLALTGVMSAMVYQIIGRVDGGFPQMLQQYIQRFPEKLSVSAAFQGEHLGWITSFLVALLVTTGGLITPPNVQRMLVARNHTQLRRALIATGVVSLVLSIIPVFIGMGAQLLLPGLARHAVLPTLVTTLFTSKITQGFAISGLLAVLMSTMDSFLHSAATTLVLDGLSLASSASDEHHHQLKQVRITSFAIGISALVITNFWQTNTYFNYAAKALAGFMFVPFLAGVSGLAVAPRDLWLSMGVGLGTVVIANAHFIQRLTDIKTWWYGGYQATAWFIAFLASAFTYLLSHYLRHGAFVRRTSATSALGQHRITLGEGIYRVTGGILSVFTDLNRSARNVVFTRYEEVYLIALFLCINYLTPYFMTAYQGYLGPFGHGMLKFIGILLCTGLMTESMWPCGMKSKYFSSYYLFTVFYCIPFSAIMILFADGGTTVSIMNLILSICLLSSLVNWQAFVPALAMGAIAASSIHYVYQGGLGLNLSFDNGYLLVYGLIYSILIGGIFVRKTAQHTADTLQEKDTFANFISHELGNHLAIMGSGAMLKAFLNQYVQQKDTPNAYQSTVNARQYEQLQGLANDLLSEQKHVKHIINTYNKLLRKGIGEDLVLTSLTAIAQQGCDAIGQELQTRTTINVIAKPDFERSLPADIFQYVVYNLVKNAIVHGQATEVTVHVDGNRQTLSVQDNGQGIPIAFLPHLFQLYHTGNSRNGTGVGLAFVQRAVASVGGALRLSQNTQTGDKHTTFEITFLL